MDFELGIPGQIMPPVANAVKYAKRAEAEGFDAIWWPCHLMGWHPESVWTEDLTPLAKVQPNPNTWFDPLTMMAAVGAQLDTAKVGVVVTDLIRRNPAQLANTLLTLDHVTGGKAILGLGSGEQLNIGPYGLPWDKPVARLAEGLDVLRLLMENDGPVSYEGKYHNLKNAVVGLGPYGDKMPEIWTAAHGPRMLQLTGRMADGWLPTKMTPPEYARNLATIRAAAKDAGRDTEAFTPGMLGYILVGPDEATVQRLTEHPLVRALCILLPGELFRSMGYEPPLEGMGSGFHDFIPTEWPRDKMLAAIDRIPPEIVRHFAFCGTPEQVTEQIRDYQQVGLKHLVMWNITAFGDPSLAGFSFRATNEIRAALKG